MTPQQLAALERVNGKPLTQAQIDAIEPLLSNRQDVQIAEVLSQGRVRVQSKDIGIGTVLAVVPAGGRFLDQLVAIGEGTDDLSRNVHWSMELIRQGRLDIGMPATRSQVSALAASHPDMATAIASLLASAEVPDPVDFNEVSRALNEAEGRTFL